MTKVGIFAPKYPPQTGGAAVYFQQVKRVLEGTEYDTHVLTTTAARQESHVHAVFPEGFVHGAAFARECYRLLRRESFELFHVHPHFPQWRIYRWIVKAMGVPTVYDCRDRLYPHRYVADGDHYLSAAEHIDDRLVSNGVPRRRITRSPVVMPDVSPISPFDTTPDAPVVAFVGDVTEAKGLPIAVSAVADMHTPELHIAGGGVYGSRLRSHESDWLRYWGELEHGRAVGLIQAADVLALPSACEGRPRVVLEALSVGTPVVATDVGDVRAVVGDAGVIVDRDSDDVRSGIRRVLSDGRFAERARARDVSGDVADLRAGLLAAYSAASNA